MTRRLALYASLARTTSTGATLLLGATVALTTLDAHGQTTAKEPPAGDAQSAIVLAKEAKDHYDRGEWKTALDLFVAAEGRAHSPVLLLYVARCRRNLGELVAAREQYRSVANAALAADAPAPFRTAKEDAAADLRALEGRIPLLTIDRSALPPAAVIDVDGRVLTPGELGSATPVDPGLRIVRATLDGKELTRGEVTMVEGTPTTLRLTPPAPQPIDRATGPRPIEKPITPEANEPSVVFDVVGVIALSLGAGGLGAGIGMRVAAFDIIEDVRARCDAGVCLPEDEAEVERAVDLETFSTVAFVAGGVLAATGITFLIVGATNRSGVALSVSPTALSVQTRF
jgi:hypothetical protein